MDHLIKTFYEAFINLDAETMISCYHEDVIFEDPAFGVLSGNRAGNMWRMLCDSQKGKDFQVRYANVTSNSETGSAHWEAQYHFSKTNRKVHNKIDAQFEFKEGKIYRHTDTFDLHRWARQALGFKGLLLGGTGFFQKKLQVQTNRLLDKFESQL